MLLIALLMLCVSCASVEQYRALADTFDVFQAETYAMNEELSDAFDEAARDLREQADAQEALQEGLKDLGGSAMTLGDGGLLGAALLALRQIHRMRKPPPDLNP